MNAPNESKKVNLGGPITVVRKQLLEDADTKAIAKAFKMPLEKYVDLVLMYAQNPEREPQLTVLDEDEMQEEGADLPTQAEVMDWLNKVESGEIVLGGPVDAQDVLEKTKKSPNSAKFSGLTAAPRPSPFVDGGPQASSQAGSILKKQLQSQRAQASLKSPGSNKKKQ